MKTVQLSQFNPSDITELFTGERISGVEYNPQDGVVSLEYAIASPKELGSVLAVSPRSISDADVVDGELIVSFDNATQINAGQVAPEFTYTYPPVLGLGILTDPETGQYKTLVSNDPNLSITQTSDAVTIAASVDGSVVSLEGALDINVSALFKNMVTSVTPAVISIPSLADTWNRRYFNTSVYSEISLSYSDGVFTLAAGTYYFEIREPAHNVGRSILAIRDIDSGDFLLEGVAVGATNTASQMELSLTGYVRLTAETDIEIVQYTETARTSGLGLITLNETLGLTAEAGSLLMYKVSGTALTTSTTSGELAEPEILTRIRAMQAEYSDRNPVSRRLFGEMQPSCWMDAVHVGDKVYLCAGESSSICEWDIVTDEVTYYPITKSVAANQYLHAIHVDGWLYILPGSSGSVIRFNVSTKQIEYTNYGISLSGSMKWVSATYCPVSGKIYCIPSSASDFLVINVAAQTAERVTFGLTLGTGTSKFCKAVYLNQKIYCIPSSSTSICVIDTSNDTAVLTTMGATLTGASKWANAYYDNVSGLIVAVPADATDLLIIDTATDTATRNAWGPTLSGTAKWGNAGGINSDGVIFMLPGLSARDYLKVNVRTATAERKPMPGFLPNNVGCFNGGVVVNDKLYLANWNYHDAVISFDTVTEGFKLTDHRRCNIAVGATTTIRFCGIVRNTRDIAYPVPHATNLVYAIDAINDRLTVIPPPVAYVTSTSAYFDGAMGLDGDVYFCPHSSNQLLKVVSSTEQGTRRVPGNRQHLDLTPALTSNSQDGYVLSANSSFSAGYPEWKAFDKIKNGTNHGWSTTSRAYSEFDPNWIQIEFPVATRVDVFRFRTGYNYNLRTGALFGSNNGTTWTKLTDIKSTIVSSFILSDDYLIPSPGEYKFYRVEVYSSTSSVYSNFGELYFMQFDPNEPELFNLVYDTNDRLSPVQSVASSSNVNTTSVETKACGTQRPEAVADTWISTNTVGPHWIEFRHFTPQKVNGLVFHNSAAAFATQLTLSGSNDGVNFTTIEVLNVTNDNVAYEMQAPMYFENEVSYLFHRVTITGNNANQAGFGKLELLTEEEYDSANWFGRLELVPWYESSGASKWSGAVTDPNTGKIYFVPSSATDIGVLDVANKTFERTTFGKAAILGTGKYIGATISPYDGKIYGTPSGSMGALIVNPDVTYDTTFTDARLTITYDHSYFKLAPDGKHYAAPSTHISFLTMDTEFGSIYVDYYDTTITGSLKYRATSLGPNGKIYYSPYSSTNHAEVDVLNRTINYIDSLDSTGTQVFFGSVVLSNGMIIMGSRYGGVSEVKGAFYALDFGPDITLEPELVNSPYFQ